MYKSTVGLALLLASLAAGQQPAGKELPLHRPMPLGPELIPGPPEALPPAPERVPLPGTAGPPAGGPPGGVRPPAPPPTPPDDLLPTPRREPSLLGQPRTPPPDVTALHAELNRLRQARETLRKERLGVTWPENAPDRESSLQLRLRVATLLARLRENRAKRAKPAAPAAPVKPSPAPPPSPEAPAKPPAAQEGKTSPKPPATPTLPPPRTEPKTPAVLTETPVDSAALARTLFHSRDYQGALKEYRSLLTTEQLAEDRLVTQYMIATCLRRLGKPEEAAPLYREVANSGGPEMLIENAQWHLQAMRARQELEGELQKVRSRREALLGKKP